MFSNVYTERLSTYPLSRNFWKNSRLNSCQSCLNPFLLTWNLPKAIKSKLKTLLSCLSLISDLRNSTILQNVYALQVIFNTSSSKLWIPKLYLSLEILGYFLFNVCTKFNTSSSGYGFNSILNSAKSSRINFVPIYSMMSMILHIQILLGVPHQKYNVFNALSVSVSL